jgi:hypothetical protein
MPAPMDPNYLKIMELLDQVDGLLDADLDADGTMTYAQLDDIDMMLQKLKKDTFDMKTKRPARHAQKRALR